MEYVIGIDAGASRTRALALARDGRVLGSSEAGGANFTASSDAESNVRAALRAVLHSGEAPVAIALCGAGLESRAPAARALELLTREKPPASRAVVTHDARAALYAASPRGVGVVLVAGTGAIAYGRDAAGREARASGWGHLIGDEGSLVWLGREAVAAAARAADGRAPRGRRLAAEVLAELGVAELHDALDALHRDPHPAPALMAGARALARAAAAGDDEAVRIVAVGADELAGAAAVISHELALDDIYLAGGAFAAIPALENATRERLAAVLPRSRVETARDEPVRGAARIAALDAWGVAP